MKFFTSYNFLLFPITVFSWIHISLAAPPNPYNFYQYNSKFVEFQQAYTNWGAWAVFIAGVTPFPYKVITILSWATHLDFGIFSFASLFARGFRFFIITTLLWYFGESIRDFIERRLGFLFLIFVVLLLCGYLFVKFLL